MNCHKGLGLFLSYIPLYLFFFNVTVANNTANIIMRISHPPPHLPTSAHEVKRKQILPGACEKRGKQGIQKCLCVP